jgi:nucleoside-diphosphate-sugar epimerase
MKVLVTGAAGFIGAHVVAALARRGADPVALVRSRTVRPLNIAALDDSHVVEADYHDVARLEQVFQDVRPGAVVHCAWRLAPGGGYLDDPANLRELEASLRFLDVARRHGCSRVVGIGTCLEYGASEQPVSEVAPLEPQSVYAASKAALYLAGQAWSRAVGVSFAWARVYYTFGPGEPPHRLVPSVVNALLRGERIATTTGQQRRSFLFVEDVADAIAAITLSTEDGPFNVGSKDVVSVRAMIEGIADVLGRGDLLDIGKLPPRAEPDVLWADTKRLETRLAWKPGTELEEALERTIAWWKEVPVGGGD